MFGKTMTLLLAIGVVFTSTVDTLAMLLSSIWAAMKCESSGSEASIGEWLLIKVASFPASSWHTSTYRAITYAPKNLYNNVLVCHINKGESDLMTSHLLTHLISTPHLLGICS